MDKRKEANQRVKSQITHALTELMHEKAYDTISVSELVLRAEVSRVSYYRNYHCKEDILTDTLENLITRFASEINTLPKNTPMRRIMTVFFHIAREHAESFWLLHQAGMDDHLQQALRQFILESPHFPSMDRRRTYPVCLFSGALFQLLLQWYAHDMNESDAELSNLFCQYMSGLL